MISLCADHAVLNASTPWAGLFCHGVRAVLTISRSVERVFQVIELFNQRRRPLQAADVRNALKLPHSSNLSLLRRLVALGYLDYDLLSRAFYPSLQLHRLCDTLPKTISNGSRLAVLADRVQSEVEETTCINRLTDLFTLTLYVRPALHTDSPRVAPGVCDGLATLSVAGQTLMSMLPDERLARMIDRTTFWSSRAGIQSRLERDHIMCNVRFARANGYLSGGNVPSNSFVAVSCPLPSGFAAEPLVLTVIGNATRVERNVQNIADVLMREVAEFSDARGVRSRQRVRLPERVRKQASG